MSVLPSSTAMLSAGKPELGGDDLRVGRLVALALRLGAEPADAAAGRMDADLGGIEHRDAEDVAVARRAGADDLGEERDADAHQLARLAALERFRACLLLLAQLACSRPSRSPSFMAV